MKKSDSLENNLKYLKHVTVPVDFDRQFGIIEERLQAHRSSSAAFRTLLRPTFALAATCLVLMAAYLIPLQQKTAAQPVDEFMASVFTMASGESDTTNSEYVSLLIDGTLEQESVFN